MSKIDIDALVGLGILAFIGAVLLALLLAATSALLVMIAWNVVVPLFHGPTINYWQAFGVNILLLIIKSVFFDRK
jgi:hypothetical protein